MAVIGEDSARVALVVGASRGIGLEFVRQLLTIPQFETVWATYRTRESATGLLEMAQSDMAEGDRLQCLSMDVTDEGQIASGLVEIKQQTKHLHLVVNCVGILHDDTMRPEKGLRQLEMEQLTRYFQTNSIPSALLAKHLLPLLKHRDRSVFASISAKVGSIGDNFLGGWYGYRASKAALNMLMRTAAIEYRRKSPETIIVTLHPGTTDTDLSKPFQSNVPPEKLFSTERTVSQLLDVISGLELEDSGQFFNWDGQPLPW
ncbi:MAG: SDR family NAD(P)-dependent oxidoreductase [Synechococcus sp.]